jgi:hypothetical protein
MEVLKRTFPNIPEEFLLISLDETDGDVADASELLRLNLGNPIDTEDRNTISSSGNGIPSDDGDLRRTRPEPIKQKIEIIQPESSNDDVWPKSSTGK